MKKLVLIIVSLFFITSIGFSQHISNETKTYYDEAKTKLKEVFSYKESYTFSATGDQSVVNTEKKKHGPYFYYYESGKMKISGWYNSGKKDKTWKYYDEKGIIIKTEDYKAGTLIKK